MCRRHRRAPLIHRRPSGPGTDRARAPQPVVARLSCRPSDSVITLRSQAVTMLAVFAALLGLYGLLSPGRGWFGLGYEPVYGAAAEGFIRTGNVQLVSESPLFEAALGYPATQPKPGRAYPGPTVGWGGPITAIPLTLPAIGLDSLWSHVKGAPSTVFREAAGHELASILTALTAVLVFVAVLMLFGSPRRALLLCLAYGVATIALGYAKIGMKPPLAFWTTAALAAGIATRYRSSI